MPDTEPAISQRELLRKVESLTENIQRSDASSAPIYAIVDAILVHLRDELGIYGARLYERLGDDYILRATFPDAKPVEETIRVPRTYPPVELCLMRGSVYMKPGDPRLDPDLEAALGAGEFAAVEVGAERYMIGFDVVPGHDLESILLSLGMVRHALNQKIREQEMVSIFHQAKQIQSSILPEAAPTFGIFDIAGRSASLDSVGGDLFDYIPIHDKILGLAIADASGHGFPAALQVRDVYMGLRMGMARDLKIVRTVERLNQIINASTLTSRFVSLFYGELEITGLFIYVNAGHPSPFHLSASGEITLLREGGPILGPLTEATYDRGFVKLQPGDLLVIYTDGITEWRAPSPDSDDEEEEYGLERLQAVARQHQGESAEAVIDAIFR
ncbi:MAG: SpoIIE family protein phosphatase, partial [Holophagales bacterium]|nr:SpoIIE family protein phosphatase [Holophagales bacterium]